MIKIIKCECGGSSMRYGRCIDCGIPRPSTKECINSIKKLQKDMDSALSSLSLAVELEKEKPSREGRCCHTCTYSDTDPLDGSELCHAKSKCTKENRESWASDKIKEVFKCTKENRESWASDKIKEVFK